MHNSDASKRWPLKHSLLFCSSLVLLICGVYGQVVNHLFVSYDDFKYVYDSYVLNGLSLEGIRYAFTAPVDANWIPLTLLSHMADVQLFGSSPVAPHLINVFLHCVNAVLLWLLLRRMTGSDARSAVVVLIFALHPLRVESVAWAAERKDVLSACFWLLALHAYAGYVSRPGVLRYLLVAVSLTAGLLAKSMLVTLPFTLLLLDFWPLGRLDFSTGWPPARVWRRLLGEKLPLLLPVIVVAIVTLRVQDQGGALNPHDDGAIYSNIVNAAVSLVIYLRQFIFPDGLAFLYPAEEWSAWQFGGALLVLVLITYGVFRQWRRQYLVFGWLWYLVTIFPVIGLVRVGIHSHADRYTYIPLIGVTVMVVWLAADLSGDQIRRRRAAVLAAIVAVGASAVVSYRQVSYWQDSYTLYHRALAVTSNNWLVHNNLAVLHYQWGQLAETERHLSEALLIRPEYLDALMNLGHLRKSQKRPQEATEAFRLAVEFNPRSANALYQLGVNLVKQGDIAGGKEMLLRLAPLDAALAAKLNDMIDSARAQLP